MKRIINKIITIFIGMILSVNSLEALCQGKNFTWLLGYHFSSASLEGRINFTQNSYAILSEQRSIPFFDTQGNVSDENGNILMSSNGIFIANSTGDTMQNGSGLNPGQVAIDFASTGLPMPYANLFLPMPGDSNEYILFHQTVDYMTGDSPDIFYSVVDMSLNGGLGQVISKNNVALNGSFGVGLTACRHANGRDWWVIALSIDGSLIYEFLLTPGNINYIGVQNLQLQPSLGFGGQPVFSPDGEKFAFRNGYVTGMNWYLYMNLFSFDRCSGIFVLDTVINYSDSTIGYGTMFSPNSQYLYFATSQHIYQVNTDTSDIAASLQTVATNDTFLSAPPNLYTNFYLMYLAANGKIYLPSTGGVLDFHEINYPDNVGTACDVDLHNIHLPCFVVGTVPNHPNYYLGAKTGSPCDTLTSITEHEHNFKFKIFPNPVTDGSFKIAYLLPQNRNGMIEIFDVNGKKIYTRILPPWSTLQYLSIPKLADGVYNCVITSAGERVSKKLLVFNE